MSIVLSGIMLAIKLMGTVAVIAAVWAVGIAWNDPRKILEMSEEIARGNEGSVPRPLLRHRAALILIFVGFAIFGFGGVYAGLSWIPNSWGVVDEDGEWSPYRYSIASLAGMTGAFLFARFMLDYCRRRLREQWRHEAERTGRN
ncbi:hypothetical protein [Mesorhizobium sp.]|uniref:hypothetical protein n=1 Tax=Mesorhizobium sp. TaxID=1871066 RepID=UPI000FEA4BCD|nr:hypothetical protein [Mesorhizobium sp.]RWO20072.1 MAG: hypothetical protein EOS09_28660 [Mesorhizobium sp.]